MNIPDLKLAREVAREGIVLLKNNGVLPLKPGTKIAVFGTAQELTWWYHLGGSSYVQLPRSRVVTLLDALRSSELLLDTEVMERYVQSDIKEFPFKTNEMPFTDDEIRYFSTRNDVAIVVLSRYTSEDMDLSLDGRPVEATWWFWHYDKQLMGTYYFRGWRLEEDEVRLIKTVSRYFKSTILILNTHGPIELEPVVDDVDAILWVGYPGEQGGFAVVDILLGRVSPSGKLPFTWAKKYEDYYSSNCFGEQVVVYCEDIFVGYRYFDTFDITPLYPFGYGLSYTSFDISDIQVSVNGEEVRVDVTINNTGSYPGKEVVQVYVILPRGELDKEYQRLVAFAKTSTLKPGEKQTVSMLFDLKQLASYSEKHAAWILEKGEYIVTVGNSSRSTKPVAILRLPESTIVVKLTNRLSPWYFHRAVLEKKIKTLRPGEQRFKAGREKLSGIPVLEINPGSITVEEAEVALPLVSKKPVGKPRDTVVTLRNVKEGKATLEEMVSQMSVEELVRITVGLRGSADPFLSKYEIPEIKQADGPNGVRQGPTQNPGGTAFPAAVLRAASWDPELEFRVGVQIGREMASYGLSLWLGPGVNIQRNPLGGRFAEYYSEDPLLTGVMGASVVKGVQSQGVGATVKHFVGNEQETHRWDGDSIVSERALREIYLKPFEIIIKTAKPWAVMSAYNKINGVFAGNNFELCTSILRGEWEFDGIVMTDWWSRSYNYKAYKAGNDALMPYTEKPWEAPWAPWANLETVLNDVKRAIERGELSLSELQRCAINVLKITLKTAKYSQSSS